MPTADEYLEAAASEVGYVESPPGSNRTKFAAEAKHENGQPWCATFLVAIAKRTGLALPSTSAYTPTMANGFKSAHRWTGTPERGDFVFYDFPDASNRIQHVGVVERVRDDGKIETIEGNTSMGNQSDGGQVMRRVRSQASVVGYGRPEYLPSVIPPPAEEDDMFTDDDRRLLQGVYGFAINTEQVLPLIVAALGDIKAMLAEVDAGSITPDEFVEKLRDRLAA